MTTALATLSSKLAHRFGMAEDAELITTLKQTAFKSREPASDAQLTALLVIANEYGLNPFTKEIYAYPDQHKGIVPVVGVDGWIRIINEHPQFDGLEFDATEEAVTCRIYRKDRTRPTAITEYLVECRRATDPWKNMPRRMLRHKALMQCARVAFGFAFYDDEEAQAAAGTLIDATTGEVIQTARRGPLATASVETVRPELPTWPAESFAAQLPRWTKAVAGGLKTAADIEALATSKGALTAEQLAQIRALKPVDPGPAADPDTAAFAADMEAAEGAPQ